jgi:hypothetical protein
MILSKKILTNLVIKDNSIIHISNEFKSNN